MENKNKQMTAATIQNQNWSYNLFKTMNMMLFNLKP